MQDFPALEEITPDLFASLTSYEKKLALAAYERVSENPYPYTWMTKVEKPSTLQYVQVAYTASWWDLGRRVIFLLVVPGTVATTFAVQTSLRWLFIVGLPLLLAAVIAITLLAVRANKTNAYFRKRLGIPEPPPKW